MSCNLQCGGPDNTCPRKQITLNSKYMRNTCERISLEFCHEGSELKKTRHLVLARWMRPRLNVALLCQTCQEREMDSHLDRSCNGQGWRGGADSRLTAVINHLPHQPDTGWQEGGCWREWWFVHSLPEMSFCQQVSGGILSVINLSDHLSFNSFPGSSPCVTCPI